MSAVAKCNVVHRWIPFPGRVKVVGFLLAGVVFATTANFSAFSMDCRRFVAVRGAPACREQRAIRRCSIDRALEPRRRIARRCGGGLPPFAGVTRIGRSRAADRLARCRCPRRSQSPAAKAPGATLVCSNGLTVRTAVKQHGLIHPQTLFRRFFVSCSSFRRV